MEKLCLAVFCCIIYSLSLSQNNLPRIEMLTGGTPTSIRGLSVVNDRVVWVSGSNGTVGKSTDGGKTWSWRVVKEFEKADFRDIEAFDAATAVIMAVDSPAFILKTINGGASWKVVYENKTSGMFLDAMEFWDDGGIVIGDPINGKIFVANTSNSGTTWREIPDRYKPRADSGEAFFAASGTALRALDRNETVMVSGGVRSRIFIRYKKYNLPVIQGTTTTGANSVAVFNEGKIKKGKIMTVVGGDFKRPESDSLNCFYTNTRGRTWKAPVQPPHGYRSCVEYITSRQLITCGITGVDYSADGGRNWQLISKEGFHVCRKAKKGSAVFLAGSNGKIAKLDRD